MTKRIELERIIELGEMLQEVNAHTDELEHLYIYDMESLEEVLYDRDYMDVIQMVFYGNFNPNHDYFQFNGYGNLVSYTDYDYERMLLEYADEIEEAYKEVFGE